MAWTVTRISEETIRSDLMQRGLSVSRVVALSSRYSILSEDRLALDSLAAETTSPMPGARCWRRWPRFV